MARLTREQAKKHDEAEAILSLTRKLNEDEIEFVFEHWREDAFHETTKGATYFTPFDAALCLAYQAVASTREHYVDIGAGIGSLSWALWLVSRGDVDITAIEYKPEFIEVGKKLLPQVNWVCGDIFDPDTWSGHPMYHCAISNPPFGKPYKMKRNGWLSYRGPLHLMAAEVAVKVAEQGAIMFMPAADLPFRWGLRPFKWRKANAALEQLTKAVAGIQLDPTSCDLTIVDDIEWRGTNIETQLVDVTRKIPHGEQRRLL